MKYRPLDYFKNKLKDKSPGELTGIGMLVCAGTIALGTGILAVAPLFALPVLFGTAAIVGAMTALTGVVIGIGTSIIGMKDCLNDIRAMKNSMRKWKSAATGEPASSATLAPTPNPSAAALPAPITSAFAAYADRPAANDSAAAVTLKPLVPTV